MVKINEFHDLSKDMDTKTGDKLPFNVVDDLVVYMKNDPDFYRRQLYPKMCDVQEVVKKGKKYDKKSLLPTVDDAIREYVDKFKIKKMPEEMCTREEKMMVIDQILRGEIENFRNGEY